MKPSAFPLSRYRLIALGLLAITAPALADDAPKSVPALPITPNSDGLVPVTPRSATTTLGAAIPMTPATSTQPEAPAAPLPPSDPKAKELLAQVVKRYQKLKSYSVIVEKSGRKKLIEFRAPEKLKITNYDGEGNVKSWVVYTPTEQITAQKPNDQWEWKTTTLSAPTEGKSARDRLANVDGLFLSQLLAGNNPFESGRYVGSSLSLGEPIVAAGNTLTPLVATVPKSKQFPLEQTVTLLVRDDKLVQSVKIGAKLPNGTISGTEENFSDIKRNPKFTETNFTFTPPAGATKVENFSRAQVRAAVGSTPLPLGTNVKDIDDKAISLEQYKGKVVLIDFWATWCGPCIAELPNVKAAYAKYKDQGFDVLGISLDQKKEPLLKYIQEKELPWRQVFDGYWEGPIATAFNIRAIPSTILIGKDGKIAAIGARGEKLEPAIQAALAAPTPAE